VTDSFLTETAMKPQYTSAISTTRSSPITDLMRWLAPCLLLVAAVWLTPAKANAQEYPPQVIFDGVGYSVLSADSPGIYNGGYYGDYTYIVGEDLGYLDDSDPDFPVWIPDIENVTYHATAWFAVGLSIESDGLTGVSIVNTTTFDFVNYAGNYDFSTGEYDIFGQDFGLTNTNTDGSPWSP